MASRAERFDDAPLAGPLPIAASDIPMLNGLFSAAFTERYRRDGLVGVRVPPLNPAIWQYAIRGAGAGAMLWRDGTGAIAAFNVAHASGLEGWMGPLAVREDLQEMGNGTRVVEAGVAHLRRMGCHTIGLETMPRTVDNIGFYTGLGFVPGYLTVTLTLEAGTSSSVHEVLPPASSPHRDEIVAECAALTHRLTAGADYSREMRLTQELSLGDTLIHRRGGRIDAFAICHAAPLVEGRSREELRVLKLVAADLDAFEALLPELVALSRRSATARVALRMQGEASDAYAMVAKRGARVRWTDLRMTLDGYPQPTRGAGVVLTNWEI